MSAASKSQSCFTISHPLSLLLFNTESSAGSLGSYFQDLEAARHLRLSLLNPSTTAGNLCNRRQKLNGREVPTIGCLCVCVRMHACVRVLCGEWRGTTKHHMALQLGRKKIAKGKNNPGKIEYGWQKSAQASSFSMLFSFPKGCYCHFFP